MFSFEIWFLIFYLPASEIFKKLVQTKTTQQKTTRDADFAFPIKIEMKILKKNLLKNIV
jgi:hypothetical protein